MRDLVIDQRFKAFTEQLSETARRTFDAQFAHLVLRDLSCDSLEVFVVDNEELGFCYKKGERQLYIALILDKHEQTWSRHS